MQCNPGKPAADNPGLRCAASGLRKQKKNRHPVEKRGPGAKSEVVHRVCVSRKGIIPEAYRMSRTRTGKHHRSVEMMRQRPHLMTRTAYGLGARYDLVLGGLGGIISGDRGF